MTSLHLRFGVPLASGNMSTSVRLLDRPELPPAERPELDIRPTSPGYLEAAGVRLLRGRWFTSEDTRAAPGVVVVNETAVRVHYADVDPIGRRLRADVSWGFADDMERTIVGVVADTRTHSVTAAPTAALYLPNAQFAANSVYVSLRLRPGHASAMQEARAVIGELDPALAVTDVASMEEVVAADLAGARFYMTLLTVFSVVAVLLAAVGLYGVVAFAVSRRTREIGIRMALGAARDEVTRMVVAQGARPAALGIVTGLAASWYGARVLNELLYGVEPQDPATIAVVTVLLASVVLLATVVPARRASRMRVEP